MTSLPGIDENSEVTAVPSRSQTGITQTLDNTGYCLLSLDGGGVRGLSTLYILQGIMNRLNYMREEHGLRERKPCEIFDLIGGTSTGGLIAIMLGRLEMTVEECIDAYTRLMKQIFEKKENRSIVSMLGVVKPRFSSETLENAIKQLLQRRAISVDEKLDNGQRGKCKVFVCTKFQKTNVTTRLRSYRTPSSSTSFSPTILEAALATSAAPTYFSPASINSSHFIDGAIGANNPCLELEEEATDLWCEETGNLQPLVKCFISIGTGHQGIRSVSDKGMKGLIETLRKEATETEKTNQTWQGRWREHVDKGRAFRFNVDHGLDGVKLAEFEEQDLLSAATATYLQKRGTIGEVRSCVENLRMKECM
ncbi:phospholipase [Byssothecium circinans]|uniref:Phospholipase n=1 Tax=Byssothecium circinans TaxID=147558 RepID=A0A6A5U968_9PLEO|nr:phospholipase [Byssothecium circinans]